MRFDLTSFGEGVLRLSVPAGRRIETTRSLDVDVSGTEANVASALSRLGWRCGWISALPDTPPGRRVEQAFRPHGVDLSSLIWREQGRVSTYFVEYSNPPRPTMIYYDRKDSCFTKLTPDDIDWDYLLDTRHVHLSGLTVPLSESVGEIIAVALARAKEKGITTSFDVNYRHLLWSKEDAREKLTKLSQDIDLLFLARRDAEIVFGCGGEVSEIVEQMSRMTAARNIVMSLSSDGVVGWDGNEIRHVKARDVGIVDRIGAGDAMISGVLHGWFAGDLFKGLQYGVVMAALAMSQFGEAVVTNRTELERLLAADPIDIVR